MQIDWEMVFNRVGSGFITGLPADNRIPELLYLGTNRGVKMLKKIDIKDYKNKQQLVWFGIINKINELCDIINTIQKEREAERFEIQEWIGILEAMRKSVNIHEKQIDELQMKAEPELSKNVRPPYMQNKRLRKALGIAQSALVKLANDAYDMDEHIYIDKILNQIERITKGGDNE